MFDSADRPLDGDRSGMHMILYTHTHAHTHTSLLNPDLKPNLETNRWWLQSDKPWQTLAACKELAVMNHRVWSRLNDGDW